MFHRHVIHDDDGFASFWQIFVYTNDRNFVFCFKIFADIHAAYNITTARIFFLILLLITLFVFQQAHLYFARNMKIKYLT